MISLRGSLPAPFDRYAKDIREKAFGWVGDFDEDDYEITLCLMVRDYNDYWITKITLTIDERGDISLYDNFLDEEHEYRWSDFDIVLKKYTL